MKIRYAIKSVPCDDTKALEDLLNEMAETGWDLYTMQELETEDGFVFNCIFTSEKQNEKKEDDIINIKSFRSQMEKILYASQSPYLSCKEIQEKIKQQRQKIQEIKTELEKETEIPVSKNRQILNDKMSDSLKKLEELRQSLFKTISPNEMFSKIKQNKLTISLGEEIIDIVNPDFGAELVSETVKVREKLVEDLGYVLPKVVFEDDYDLEPYEFSIKIRGLEVLKSGVYVNCKAYFEDELKLSKKKKLKTSFDEITGKTIVWVEKEQTKDFWAQGISASEYISRMLKYVVIKHIDELFDYNDVGKYMEIVNDENPFLCENILPDFLSVSDLKYILVNLLKEEVSIKDIVYIFEKLNDYAEDSMKDDLIDKIRFALSSHISKKLANEENSIVAFDISEKTLKKIFADFDEETGVIKIDDETAEKIKNKILKMAKKYDISQDEIILCAPQEERRMIFLVLSHLIPKVKVISKLEVASNYVIEILDEI